jgi:hypothetical protein
VAEGRHRGTRPEVQQFDEDAGVVPPRALSVTARPGPKALLDTADLAQALLELQEGQS